MPLPLSHPIIHVYKKNCVNCMYVHEDITSHYQHCFARPTFYERFLVYLILLQIFTSIDNPDAIRPSGYEASLRVYQSYIHAIL